jgi:hypothetical protein
MNLEPADHTAAMAIDPPGNLDLALLTDLPEWPVLLDRLIREIYVPNFPNQDEREDPAAWRQRLTIHSPPPPQPSTYIFVAGANLRSADDNQRILDGFVIVELYRDSRCALATYLAVATQSRKRRVSSQLLTYAVTALSRETKLADRPLRALFAEITDPHKPKAGATADFDPFDRVVIMSRIGWRHVPIEYVQPALGGDRARVRHLMLWAYPIDGKPLAAISTPDLCAFLREFYRALGVERPDEDPDFQAMTRTARTESLPVEIGETPMLSFDTYGIAFHYLLPRISRTQSHSIRSSSAFRSFERDLLSWSFRERPPFWSAVVEVPEELSRLQLVLPNVVRYEAEGAFKWLLVNPGDGSSGSERRRAVRLSASLTVFSSGGEDGDDTAVLHLVLSPDRSESGRDGATVACALSEWDLVTLIKLWEGGEGVDDSETDRLSERVWFASLSDECPRTLAELAEEVFRVPLRLKEGGTMDVTSRARPREGRAACLRAPRAGTVQLLTGAPSGEVDWVALFGALADRYGGHGVAAPAEGAAKLDAQVCAVAGILQGLLDFRDIATDELGDAFQSGPTLDPARRSVRLDDGLVLGIHKGTLLDITEDCRVYRRASAEVGISPYLIVPHAVLLYNNHLLEVAEEAYHPRRQTVAETETAMRGALEGRYLANVFHYPLERYLFEVGMASRGLTDRKASLERRLAQVSGEARDSRDRRQHQFEKRVNYYVLALAGLQIMAVFSLLDASFSPEFLSGLAATIGLRNRPWLGWVRLVGPVVLPVLVGVVVAYLIRKLPNED